MVVTALSVVGGVFTYFVRSNKDLKLKQWQRFGEIDIAYVEFQKTVLDHTHLDVAWVQHENPPKLAEDDRIKRTVIFELATSLFEKAFVLYIDAPRHIKKAQWHGWREYIKGYCAKPEYRRWWFGEHVDESGVNRTQNANFDASFEEFMRKLFKEVSV